MTIQRRRFVLTWTIGFALFAASANGQQPDPLPSWNDGPTKQAIISFVEKVTKEGGPDFVRPALRIATFDNDGTLWVEKPMYTQVVFAVDRVKTLAPQHPEWKTEEPFKSLLAGDMKAVLEGGEKAGMKIMMSSHANLTTDEFTKIVTDWVRTAKHPRFDRLYTKLAYQPMLEVLTYLRKSGFKTFIVSGGGIDFMRPWTQRAYGVPPQQVVGSSIKVQFEMREGGPVLYRMPDVDFIDDGPGKPIGIYRFIGRRPIIAFGNSDGDLEMLQWTTMVDSEPGRPGTRLGMIVHHTDAVREYAYDRDSIVGRLDKALDQAPERGWILINMKDDWRTIFPE
jgi:haloacid dehalogenase-like hydrolase